METEIQDVSSWKYRAAEKHEYLIHTFCTEDSPTSYVRFLTFWASDWEVTDFISFSLCHYPTLNTNRYLRHSRQILCPLPP